MPSRFEPKICNVVVGPFTTIEAGVICVMVGPPELDDPVAMRPMPACDVSPAASRSVNQMAPSDPAVMPDAAPLKCHRCRRARRRNPADRILPAEPDRAVRAKRDRPQPVGRSGNGEGADDTCSGDFSDRAFRAGEPQSSARRRPRA